MVEDLMRFEGFSPVAAGKATAVTFSSSWGKARFLVALVLLSALDLVLPFF